MHSGEVGRLHTNIPDRPTGRGTRQAGPGGPGGTTGRPSAGCPNFGTLSAAGRRDSRAAPRLACLVRRPLDHEQGAFDAADLPQRRRQLVLARIRGELAQELARPHGPGRRGGPHPQDVRPVAVGQVHVHLPADQSRKQQGEFALRLKLLLVAWSADHNGVGRAARSQIPRRAGN